VHFTFVTLFPELVEGYFSASILGRAKEQGDIEIDFVNPREFSQNRHLKVDDYQAGGGAGLVMMAEPLDLALKNIKSKFPNAHTIFFNSIG